MINENEPVKCKDCNIWWRGLTHRCEPPKVDTSSKHSHPAGTQPTKDSGWIHCPKCTKRISKYDWHSCEKYHKHWRNENDKHDRPKNYPPQWEA